MRHRLQDRYDAVKAIKLGFFIEIFKLIVSLVDTGLYHYEMDQLDIQPVKRINIYKEFSDDDEDEGKDLYRYD